MIAGKVWGTTELLLATPFLEVHRLVVRPGGYCSLHKHVHRWNAFLVTRGALIIEVRQDAYPLVDETLLAAGQLTTVAPALMHRFRSGYGSGLTEAYELYYPSPLLPDDIERLVVGGKEGDGA